MTTLGQVLANRENAQLSTGPKTAEGKARSAQNSVTHGLCANAVVTKGEDRASYETFAAAYLGELDPQTVAQLELAERIVGLVWKARRAEAVETALWDSGARTPAEMATMLCTHGRELDAVLRYARQIERQLASARSAYRQMQAEAVCRQADESVAAAAAEETRAREKQKREEEAWLLVRSSMEADMAASDAGEKARKEGQGVSAVARLKNHAWHGTYGVEIMRMRKELGRPIGQLMADGWYVDDAEIET